MCLNVERLDTVCNWPWGAIVIVNNNTCIIDSRIARIAVNSNMFSYNVARI